MYILFIIIDKIFDQLLVKILYKLEYVYEFYLGTSVKDFLSFLSGWIV